MTTEREQIPRTLRVLWGEETRRTRGPHQALSLDRIVDAGIAIADAEGIASLSMARLAERLGSAPMSLYRHVSSKDELLIFMTDAAPGPPPELPAGDWRARFEAWARALRAVYYAHPWILQVTTGRPPLEPGQLGWLDRGLSSLDGTDLSHADRFETVMTVLNYVRGEAQITTILLKGGPGEGVDPLGPQQDYGELVARFVSPDRFPALAAALDAGIFRSDAGPDASFDFGLTRILDGVEKLIAPPR
ncbi:MAG TPA: TetR/AcrR family transcriptional regulator [Actinoplanes sp.]|jgi:AcrR family transcriptional regulator|nr:TetR/AcrR family transcriptional regulator [Actinoplanes sp.]